jgi:hypothetical protein
MKSVVPTTQKENIAGSAVHSTRQRGPVPSTGNAKPVRLPSEVASAAQSSSTADSDDDKPFDLRLWLRELWERWKPKTSSDSISFLSSLCAHVALILILALISLTASKPSRSLIFSLSDGEPNLQSASLELESSSGSEKTAELETPESFATTTAIASIDDLRPSETNLSLDAMVNEQTMRESITSALIPAELTSSIRDSSTASSASKSKLFSGSSLEGRSDANRNRLALQNGGSKESEDAVDAALAWFAAHQTPDGSWSMEMTAKPCNGKCNHGTEEVGSPKKIAATGLALLCFLGAGQTHKSGKYQEEVGKGLAFLTKAIARDGRLVRDDPRYELYEHGIAVLALSEACEMTADTSLLPTIRLGIDYLIRCQHPDGSWGYTPNVTGDLSIVGWQMMAIKSAHKIGVRVTPDTVEKVDRFMDSQQSDYGSYYGYRSSQRDPCMTAIGLLLRLYRGWPRTDPRILKGADYIADLGPSTNGIYYNYYATQLLFHLKHSDWETWNRMNRDYLVREQSKDGHSKGSWYIGKSHFNQVGGRLYCTAMATLSLEVYYRFMPIYDEIRDEFAL